MAENGKTGMEMWESVMPDLVIIDMMMETWGEGFSVLKKIRATDAGQNTPLFMLSAVDLQGAYGSYEPPLEFPKLNRVLHKPIKAEELLGHIAQELKNK
jgi:CheY-like chemotaxis protein